MSTNLFTTTENNLTRQDLRLQLCPVCFTPMGDMPGSRDAYCPQCGYKDPCCE